jgi:vacuolar-type H+-ATPase subunit E/Vma4
MNLLIKNVKKLLEEWINSYENELLNIPQNTKENKNDLAR